MPHPRLAAPLILPRRWQPLTDAEWEAIRPYLPDPARGGRPSDKRKTLNAIFWIAASTGPWKNLPSHLGKPDTASRALRRWARAGLLDRMLMAVSEHPRAGGSDTLRKLAWLICRAFRRMARVLPIASVMLARDLRMIPALPAPPHAIPNPRIFLSARALLQRLVLPHRTGGRAAFERLRPGLHAATALMGAGAGQPRLWRLR